jgi:hypothetical protein
MSTINSTSFEVAVDIELVVVVVELVVVVVELVVVVVELVVVVVELVVVVVELLLRPVVVAVAVGFVVVGRQDPTLVVTLVICSCLDLIFHH